MKNIARAGKRRSSRTSSEGKSRRSGTRKKTPPRPAGKRAVGGKRASAAGKKRLSSRQIRGTDAVKGVFPRLKKGDGCGILMVIVERADGDWEQVSNVCEVQLAMKDSGGRGAVGRVTRALPRTCQAFAAFGHTQRAKVMAKLLEGPATYRALQRVTRLKAGPLYHHINQLRLAGLILPKQRDLYELTRGGRNIILAAMAVGPLARDTRRRPLGT